MNAKEILEKVKAIFSGEIPPAPAPVPAPAAFDGSAIDGGSTAYTSGAIALGSAVFSDEGMTIPYPDGSYTVTGTSFSFTVTAGVVSATTGDLNATQAPAAPVVPAAPAMQPMPQITQLQADVDSLKEENARLVAALELANTLIQKHEKTIPALFELCEELTQVPTSDPVTLTGRKKEVFERMQKSDDKINNIAENLKKIRQNKN